MNLKLRKIDVIFIVIMIAIAAIVFIRAGYGPEDEKPNVPEIRFYKDDVNKLLVVQYISSSNIPWDDIQIDGLCDKSNLGEFVRVGDEIVDCSGIIDIIHKPTQTLLYHWKFTPRPTLPGSIILSNMRAVSPEDEGAHFNKIQNTREWWYYTVVFGEDSELSGWVANIAFMHMAWGDLRFTFKPDILVVTLHSPDGKEFGGLKASDRGKILGFLGNPTFEATSPGVDLQYEESWAKGEAPEWHVHAEFIEDSSQNEIIIDLDFFAPSSPYWTQSSRIIDKGEGNLANYVYTGCEVDGEVTIDGLEYIVNGLGHHEHCWSPGLIKTSIKGWDWCHITLDDGWNVYYSNYYYTRDLFTPDSNKVNPNAIVFVTTDKGDTLTLLQDVELTVTRSSKLFLLVQMPSELKISATPSNLMQPLLSSYNVQLDMDIVADNTYERTWKTPTHVGMKLGLNEIIGKISWSDDSGDHVVDLNGLGAIWFMRR